MLTKEQETLLGQLMKQRKSNYKNSEECDKLGIYGEEYCPLEDYDDEDDEEVPY